jgi:tRNA G10  N-methylase Trm11
MDLIKKYNKKSHVDALHNLKNIYGNIKHEIKINTFIANTLKKYELRNKNFCADIIITDVPYGDLVAWSDKTDDQISVLLNTIIPVINKTSIIAITHDKGQKINNEKYERLKKYKIGHRIIEILQLK